jgi:hypothetical protein
VRLRGNLQQALRKDVEKEPGQDEAARRTHPSPCRRAGAARAILARHAAQMILSSCSVTHSRQKKCPQAGQRATASRPTWLKQRCWIKLGMGAAKIRFMIQ